MNGELTWNGKKKELWKLDFKALMKMLNQIERERDALEVQYRMGGKSATRFNSNAVRSYLMTKSGSKGMIKVGSLGELKRRIACIKTILNVKFQKR